MLCLKWRDNRMTKSAPSPSKAGFRVYFVILWSCHLNNKPSDKWRNNRMTNSVPTHIQCGQGRGGGQFRHFVIASFLHKGSYLSKLIVHWGGGADFVISSSRQFLVFLNPFYNDYFLYYLTLTLCLKMKRSRNDEIHTSPLSGWLGEGV